MGWIRRTLKKILAAMGETRRQHVLAVASVVLGATVVAAVLLDQVQWVMAGVALMLLAALLLLLDVRRRQGVIVDRIKRSTDPEGSRRRRDGRDDSKVDLRLDATSRRLLAAIESGRLEAADRHQETLDALREVRSPGAAVPTPGVAAPAAAVADAVPEAGAGDAAWERRLADAWASIDRLAEDDFVGLIEGLVAELPADSAVGAFERACAFDSTGHPDQAVPLYREALERGLNGERRRRAVIQLASSLRNLGQVEESIELLTAERDAGSDHLDDAIRAFLALALVDAGRAHEAASLALNALASHLPRYQRSVRTYAHLLVGAPSARA